MAHFEKTIDSREIYSGRILRLQVDAVALEDGGTAQREVVRHAGAAAVLPLTEEGRAVLVRQYRYPIQREILEIPAGKLNDGEAPADAALRELQEETGLAAAALMELGAIYSSVGFTDEIIHLYLARDLRRNAANPDAGEFVTMEMLPFADLLEMVRSGQIQDAKTVAAVLQAALRMNGSCQIRDPGSAATGSAASASA